MFWEELRDSVDSTSSDQAHQQVSYLEGLLWLAEGDPVQAEASFGRAIKAMSAHDNAVIFRAEAIRRMGFPEDAKEIAFRRTLRNSPFLIPVRARILADLDDLQGAREALESSPSPNEIESLASRWYVARVAGEPTQELQDSWNLLNRSAGARLEALIPLE